MVPADVLSRQALEAQAGDLAIEDALYAVEKALQAGALAPDVYIKQARPGYLPFHVSVTEQMPCACSVVGALQTALLVVNKAFSLHTHISHRAALLASVVRHICGLGSSWAVHSTRLSFSQRQHAQPACAAPASECADCQGMGSWCIMKTCYYLD